VVVGEAVPTLAETETGAAEALVAIDVQCLVSQAVVVPLLSLH
jgi:hypothetical protein